MAVRETDGSQQDPHRHARRHGRAASTRPTSAPWAGTAVGVRGIRLREGDYVVRRRPCHRRASRSCPSPRTATASSTPVEEYRITNRGGLGIKNYSVTEKTGGVVGVKVVDGSEDLLLVTRAGILIRTPVDGHPHRGPRHAGRHRHALQGGGRSGHLHGARRA